MPIKSKPGEGIAGVLRNHARGIEDSANNTRPGGHFQDALTAALDYAARGFAVFPCAPRAKKPASTHGFYNATTNPATIRRWWLACSDYNIGVATGVQSCIWVLDVDGDAGATSLTALEAQHGSLPDTLTSVTADGCHFWFRYTSPVPCSADDRIGRGLHVRADRGYVLAPPSVHPDGPAYRWTNNRPLAVAPDWLVRLTRKPPPRLTISQRAISIRLSRPGRTGAYGKAALEQEIAALTHTPQGGRNAALNRASFCLFQLVAGGELNGIEVRQRLIEAATANGLMSDPHDGPRKVAKTIASGARAGLKQPRGAR